jgi:ribonucleoside-diphosphate reductase alpha chain
LFTYAGLRQVVDKYLVQDRVDNVLYETPLFMYLLIALTGFAKYPKDKRMSYVKRYYDAISKHKINIPTPILAGVRTRLRQYSSCVLVDVGDSLSSIEASDAAVFRYVAQRAGLGINAGRIRGINSKIRGGEVVHTGVIPYLKKFEATVKSCTQNGIRGGSSTVFFPVWHQEIEDIIVLKNNKGSEDNRVRNLDYAIQLSKIFYERFIQDGEITLFSPHNVPGLYEKFGLDGFDELYVKYENDPSIPKKKVKAQELIIDILKERAETGRIYLMKIDHCNSHSPFKDQITMSNLCMEILLKTTPIEHIDDVNGSIALCILSCVNVGTIKSDKELEECCDLSVRFLDELIDHQDYPVKAAELTTKASRPLGIGYIGLAHYLAKLGFKYSDPGAWEAVHKLTESFQYYLLKSSNNLAREKGACDNFKHTKYSDGILPIDTYKKEVDEICNVEYTHDWEQLRQDILEYGLRHTTLSAQPPTESSSVSCNATNGIEPPRDYLSIKQSKKGTLKQIVPQYNKLKNNYTLLWEMPSNEGYINCVSIMQKFVDQGISVNDSYNPQNYPNNEVPITVIVNNILLLYKYGAKTAYYHNTYDGKTDDVSAEEIKNNDLISEILSSEEEEECIACNV